jgi:protein-tyrosine phosphatase
VIDTHCHLLPGIDDGARDEDETIEMCRLALEDGVHTIVATPHAFDGAYVNHPDNVRQLSGMVNELLTERDMGITVLPGMELRIVPELLKLLLNGLAPAINDNKYLLMEFPPNQLPAGFDYLVQKAVDNRYGLILAHPEKNLAIQGRPDYVFGLLKRFDPWDVLVQVTAASITGLSGRRVARTARILLENNMVHVIASDAHDTVNRPPILSEAVEAAGKMLGRRRVAQMVGAVPEAVIGHGPFPDYWAPQSPRRWWRIL